ncbi:unnamed protein product, partial [Didymodactylos carnosus]
MIFLASKDSIILIYQKNDFIQYDEETKSETNIQYDEKNFVSLFKRAFLNNDNSSIESYDRALKINPYFFEAQYQKLLKFYESNDCEKMYHLHKTFKDLIKPVTSIKDLFEILMDSKSCSDDKKKKKSSIFFNKLVKIKVTNNQNKSFYLHFSETQDSEQIKLNDQEQLINLLKYDRKSLVKMKKNSNKSLKLKYQLSNLDFQQLIRDLLDKIDQQESKFFELIQLFKKLEFVNENEYKKLDENFRKLLPKTRFNLIKCQINSNNFQSICEISKSIKEFQTFLNPLKSQCKEINRKILQLIVLRANIYRKNHYFYLEELEFLTILTHQKTNIDHNP